MPKMLALLVHLGMNMWEKYYNTFEFDESVWDKIIDKCSEYNFTHIVLDIGEGIRFNSHPEFSIEGAWTPNRVKREVVRLREKGITLIPKLNFSAGHDLWLKEYGREKMSTPEYYAVCKDLIVETAEMFDYPKYFHLGLDEEFDDIRTPENFYREKEQKLKDYRYLCDWVRARGMQPLIWQGPFYDYPDAEDYLGSHLTICPDMYYAYDKKDWHKLSEQSDWVKGYYKNDFKNRRSYPEYVAKYGDVPIEYIEQDPAVPKTIKKSEEYIKNGFQIVVTSSNIFSKINDRAGVEYYFNRQDLRHGIAGFIGCPWKKTLKEFEADILEEIELLGSAYKEFYIDRADEIPVITRTDIKKAVEELGIKKGDTVLVHSSYKSVGKLENGAEDIVGGFLDVIDREEGNLVFPTFTQKDFINAYKTWHLDKPSDTGYLTNYFRTLPDAVRSDQATHSVAVIGKDKYRLTKTHGHTAGRYGEFGESPFAADSPWEKMYWSNAKIVLFGVLFRSVTFRHYAEYCFIEDCLRSIEKHPDYQKMKDELQDFGKPGIWPHTGNMWVYDKMKKQGLVTHSACGDATLLCVGAKDFTDCVTDALKNYEEGILGMYGDKFWDWLERVEKMRIEIQE